ncbi:MAG: ATP-binding cassette domain-containing protein [Hyphomicrobiaceae bacterium]
MTALLSVDGLSKRFRTRHGTVKAVDGVSFDVARGETVALVGESGCGKTTVALSLLRLIEPDGGVVQFEGAELAGSGGQAWRQRLSIVFQNPYSSLDPRMRIRDIVGEPLVTAYGLSGKALSERVARHMSEVGLGPEHMKRFPHEFSGGQRQRIAIARAIALEPQLLILDEPTAALDVSVQAQVLNLLQDLQKRLGLSYLFISHNLATVESVADKVLIMYLGRVVEAGPVSEVFARPRHPYTQALLDSVPSIDPSHRGRLKPVTGELPSTLNPPPGCAFAPRCARATSECRASPPPLVAIGDGRAHACLHPLE